MSTNIVEIKRMLDTPQYDFLRTNPLLKDNIILLGLGGSHAYGTNIEGSDVDVRGIATNTKRNILTGYDFEQTVNTNTDTTIYSFNKIVKLLSKCNPNTIEMLGLKPEHYIYLNDIGKLLLDNKNIFLSKRAVYSFGGYASAQLHRLENKTTRDISQDAQEKHILKTIQYAALDFPDRYFSFPEDAINLYVDKSQQEDYDTEIFCDINLTHYPLRDYRGMVSEMQEIIKSYSKIGKRNGNAITRGKLGKHMMHLVRLYLMCFDILDKGEINTYREKDHDFLMSIRNGAYLDSDDKPVPEFFDIIKEYEVQLDNFCQTTNLPDTPDMKKINDLVEEVNSNIIYNNPTEYKYGTQI